MASDFPDIALQEFWATFDLNEHKRRQGQKVFTFYLGGVYRTLTYDEFAAHLGIPYEHYHGHHLGWGDDDDEEVYHALWSHMTGVPGDRLTDHNSVKSLSHPLFKFIHMVWRSSLLYAPDKDRHHINKDELLLLRAIRESYPLHPGWVLARIFRQKTKRRSPARALLGGNFIGQLIISFGLSQEYGPNIPRRRVRTFGGDLAVEYDLELDLSPQHVAESEEEDDSEQPQLQPQPEFHDHIPSPHHQAGYAHQAPHPQPRPHPADVGELFER
ncbi:hypothetical protein LINPERHAP1_LOCUS15279, partial [Linum perenne]